MTSRMTAKWNVFCAQAMLIAGSLFLLAVSGGQAAAQRAMGLDVSYWQSEISPTAWDYAYDSTDRRFVFVRSSRGGTTGLSQPDGTPGGGSQTTLSRRYDDPRFIQNMVRANTAGLMTGPYHFARPDILTNTGADEADHYIQMAGAYMRPGYIVPMYDFEAGQAERTQQDLAQFTLDFSNRIYAVMNIRPSIYASGNYFNDLTGANLATRNAIAQPSSTPPSMVSPAFPYLVGARYPAGSGNPYNEAVHGSLQTQNPKDAGGSLSTYFGPFDDYGNSQPWNAWQYSSGEAPFGPNGDTTTDGDVSQGDIEFVRDMLVPAVWWNDASGDWSTLTNWNSGQPVVAPQVGAGQAAQFTTGPLPVARLPGAAGTGPTSGQYDTVILERPNANITVTLSTGTHNIRKLYMRETLDITGGSLTINYDPNYSNDFDNNPATTFPNALRSGLISAQFSGPVTLSGTGSLSVNTLQVDASKTFTLAGSAGTLTFKQINLLSSAKIAVTGDANIDPLSNTTATISGSSGSVDLSAGVRIFTVGNGTSDVDLDVVSPITNGGLTKNGAGTMKLSGSNTFSGAVTVNAGVLRSGNATGFSPNSAVTVNSGGTLDMNGITDTIASLSGSGGNVTQGLAGLTISATSGSNTYAGTITGSGTFTKSGASSQTLSGSNSLGAVAVSGGSLLFNGNSSTPAVTVSNGATLGGTGSVTGAVTVNSGGKIAPGVPGGIVESLGAGALTLNTGSILDIDLAAPGNNDAINVSGLLTLSGGSVQLTNLGGVDAGSYTLITYGTRSGPLTNLGAPTGGPSNFNYSLVDTGNAINLSVTIPGDFNTDGKVDTADYVVWRTGLGPTFTPGDYNVWRANFGRTAGSGGGGAAVGAAASVPEPATVAMLLCGLSLFVARRRR